MSVHPFAGFNPKPSTWGYNWQPPESFQEKPKQQHPPQQQPVEASPEILANQYANMPAALLNTLKREKKPFTYTPGGVNLNEVLNARLQKRMERKKKYSEEKQREVEFEPPKQVLVMPTYNSPLDMYSMENALEALEVQAELVAADKSLNSPSRSATLPRNHTFKFEEKDMDPGRGVTQSKAFRVLQIITDTEEENPKDRNKQNFQDEMRFTGIRDSKEIPSKFFHTLQKITGTDVDDEEEEQTRTAKSGAVQQQAGSGHFQAAGRPVQNEVHTRPGFLPPAAPQPASVVLNIASAPAQQSPSSGLKRPAAFLPIKTGTGQGFRSVHPPNGPLRNVGKATVGTDF